MFSGLLVAAHLALLAGSGSYAETLDGPEAGPVVLGGSVERLGLTIDGRLVAVAGGLAFERLGPGRWAPTTARPISEVEGTARLQTGETVMHVVQVPDGPQVGSVEAGLIESEDDFRHTTAPFGLPILGVRTVAPDPRDGRRLLVAGDPTGLFECEGACRRLQNGAFHGLAWFVDGTRLAGDDQGGVWREQDGRVERSQLGTAAIVDLFGVPDGGPRVAIDAAGAAWRSEDTGTTWTRVPGFEGRLGSGGQLARVTADGALDVTGLDGRIRRVAEPGLIPAGSPVRWASPELVVVGLIDGALVIDRDGGDMRRLVTSDAAPRAFFAAGASNDRLLVYCGQEGRLQRFEAPLSAPWTIQRVAGSAVDVSPLLLALGAVLAGLFVLMTIRLRSLTRR